MSHVQRLGNQGRTRVIAGVLALATGLALFSVARAPGAIGQQSGVQVGNGGGAEAGTGGNTATGNNSGNNIDGTATSGGLLGGGLVDVNIGLGSSSNTSDGTATVDSGTATASGNNSQTSVNQSSSGSGNGGGFTPFNPFQPAPGDSQSVGVSNTGGATANTGGNTATGNNSNNNITSDAGVGLVDADVGLAGPTNASDGSAAVNTGAANASGNESTNDISQSQMKGAAGGTGFGYGAGGYPPGYYQATPWQPGVYPGTVNGLGSSYDPCTGRFLPFAPFFDSTDSQSASVNNAGVAGANTGNNTAIGNNSTNNQVVNQTASGGLIGLNVNLGSPTNNSTGTATINSGDANASGNQSTTSVDQSQQACAPAGDGGGSGGHTFTRNPITGGPIVVPKVPTPTVVYSDGDGEGALARTGFESGMAVLALSLVLFGSAMIVTARRRLSPHRASASTVAAREWDSVVRW